MKRRFDRILNPKADGYEPTFLVATALDPRYQVVLDAEQIASARAALASQLKEMRQQSPTQSPSSSSTGSPAALVSVGENLMEEEPPKKRFSFLSGLIEERIKQKISKHPGFPPEEEGIKRYFSTTTTLGEKAEPVFFWIENEQVYPLLSALAFDTLIIPASSTPIERTFSTAGEATSGKRNRLSDKNLEREVLLRKNKQYL